MKNIFASLICAGLLASGNGLPATSEAKDSLDFLYQHAEIQEFLRTGQLTLDEEYSQAEAEQLNKQYLSFFDRSIQSYQQDMAGKTEEPLGQLQFVSNQTIAFDEEIAKRAAQYASVAYCPKNNVQRWKCGSRCKGRTAGTVVDTYIKDTALDLRGYVGINHNLKEIIVSFRGSVNLRNWITNLRLLKIDYDYPDAFEGARVHSGFYNGYMRVKDQVDEAVKRLATKYPEYSLFVTGHSQGGAMAAFCALDLEVHLSLNQTIRLFTFGEPRLGNYQFAEYFRYKVPETYRIVNKDDLVPHLPWKSAGFYHHTTEVWIKDYFKNEIIVCDDTNGEDKSCSSSQWFAINLIIHLQAFDSIFFPTCFF